MNKVKQKMCDLYNRCAAKGRILYMERISTLSRFPKPTTMYDERPNRSDLIMEAFHTAAKNGQVGVLVHLEQEASTFRMPQRYFDDALLKAIEAEQIRSVAWLLPRKVQPLDIERVATALKIVQNYEVIEQVCNALKTERSDAFLTAYATILDGVDASKPEHHPLINYLSMQIRNRLNALQSITYQSHSVHASDLTEQNLQIAPQPAPKS